LRGIAAAGCDVATRGMLRLIVLTHGDYDHTGNAAYLHSLTGAAIAMNPADMGMVSEGDRFAGRSQRNPLLGWLAPRLFGFGRAQRAGPNLALMDGHDLTYLGMDAEVLHLPGHSRGSIGLLTEEGDLFCGDLLTNTVGGPRLNDLIDDPAAAQASLARLRALGDRVRRVWPGHGEAFGLDEVP
jgi:glyoxylase-like metal-dependent hydrolase (beta-lactamase superfamily II)